MPADDLVLNVRQIAGYPPTANAPTTALLLMQLGIGGPYQSISPQDLVGTALSTGGSMAIAGPLSVQSLQGGSAQFSNAVINMFSAQKACIVDLAATWGTLAGVPIATVNDLSALDAALRGSTVWSFNGRTGDVRLWIDDIRCAGGAPIYSPRFEGSPRACTPPPTSNSTRLATTAFVMNALAVDFAIYAPLDSPDFSGVPTAPTAALGSSTGQIATTAFVMNAVSASTTGVSSFNTRTGAVVFTAADLTAVGGALLAGPAFTGAPTAPTAAPGTSTTQLATTAFVQNAVSGVTAGVSTFNGRAGAVTLTAADLTSAGGALLASTVAAFNGRTGAVTLIGNDISGAGGALLAGPAFTGAPTAPTPTAGDNSTRIATTAFLASYTGYAPINSPAFTGLPTAPTAALNTATTQLATTAFVMNAVAAGVSGVATFNGRTGAVTLIGNDISGAGGALLASPALTGSPTAPTATAGTSTTQLATTAFVAAAIAAGLSNATPLVNGAASAGAATTGSRADHVHPTDTSRAAATALANYLPLTGGTLTGQLNGTTASMSGAVNVLGALAAFAGSVNCTAAPTGNANFVCLNNGGTPIATFYADTALLDAVMVNNQTSSTAICRSDSFFVVSAGAAKPGGGAWTDTSDERIKTVGGDYSKGLDEVLALHPVVYTFKGNDTPTGDVRRGPTGRAGELYDGPAPFPSSPHYRQALAKTEFVGLVAQEIETIFPDMVARAAGFIDGNSVADMRSVDATNLVFALVNAVKTLAARLTTLEARTA
jgi:hypothetical protein